MHCMRGCRRDIANTVSALAAMTTRLLCSVFWLLSSSCNFISFCQAPVVAMPAAIPLCLVCMPSSPCVVPARARSARTGFTVHGAAARDPGGEMRQTLSAWERFSCKTYMARRNWPYRRTSSDHSPLLIVHADDPCYLVNVLGHDVRHAMASSLSALHWPSWLSRSIREFEAYADKETTASHFSTSISTSPDLGLRCRPVKRQL